MRKDKKKIAFYCSSLSKGGAERVFVNLAEYFRQKGYAVYIVTQYQYEDEYKINDEITRIISDLTKEETGESRVKNFIRRLSKLHRIFRQIQPDIVLSCSGKNNFMALAASTFIKSKVVVSVVADPALEYYTGLMRLLAKNYFCFADGIVLQTKQAMEYFPKRVQKKSVILPNSLNPRFIKPRYEGERRKEIVAVGRLDENKNHAMLIRAFSGLIQEFPDYTVTVYGEGESRHDLEELVKSLHLEGKVFLSGRKDSIEDRIYESRLFVMTSDAEGMPNALIEAMSLGLTVISTDCPCGGPAELIKHGENGYLIPVRDEAALTEQMRYCLSHQAETEKAGRKATEIQKRMNPDVVNGKWEEYFNGIMGQESTIC